MSVHVLAKIRVRVCVCVRARAEDMHCTCDKSPYFGHSLCNQSAADASNVEIIYL